MSWVYVAVVVVAVCNVICAVAVVSYDVDGDHGDADDVVFGCDCC